jgi:hypothetical protein
MEIDGGKQHHLVLLGREYVNTLSGVREKTHNSDAGFYRRWLPGFSGTEFRHDLIFLYPVYQRCSVHKMTQMSLVYYSY